MKKPLITIPNPILSEVTTQVTSFGNDLKSQVKLMREYLKADDGAGLAANQIGIKNRVIVIEFIDKKKKSPAGSSIPFQALINPEIIQYSEEMETSEEGCLSIPQIELPVERAKKIKVRYQDLQGKKIKITAKDILARIIQHEVDHLQGIVFTQRIKEKFLKSNPGIKNKQIIFFGSGKMAAVILKGLILIGLKPIIVTEKGKPAGRKKEIKITPVAEIAIRFNQKFYEIDTFSEFLTHNFKFNLLICADFGKIIPNNILKMANISAINIHPSLLPKYRGATPIQSAILAGEKLTGVTIIKMNPQIDQGEILAQIETQILDNDNGLTLSNRLSTLAFQLLFETLPNILKNQLQALAQVEEQATFTHKLKKTDGEINWQEPLEKIDRKIRAFYPWPGTYTILPDGKRLLIHQSHLGSRSLILDMVQLEGKKPVKWQEFIFGYRGQIPEWFDKVK